MTSKVIFAPTDLFSEEHELSVFLAGAIDMGKAVNWQEQILKWSTEKDSRTNYCFYNPRRADWDSSWNQTLDDPQFTRQVLWELDHIDNADYVFMWIPKESSAPISLLEFGYMIGSGAARDKLIIGVEPGYYRRGNIEVMCNRHKIKLCSSLWETWCKLDG
jgi:hypothetical protein